MNSHSDRVIVLVDMDCFYCQVEENLDPNLAGKPIAVVQYNAWRGGGIIAVNYPARERGVTRHMRGNEAKEKCPEIELVRVPNVRGKADLTKYREAGKKVAEVLQTFTALLQRASVDEAYMDITEAVNKRIASATNKLTTNNLKNTHVVGCDTKDFLHNIYYNELDNDNNLKLATGGMIVEEIRAAVFDKTGYKCSAGIAHNKILAKLACGLHKPNKQTILPKDGVQTLYQNLPLKKITSLGGKFGDSLSEILNITYMGELMKFSERDLLKRFDEKTASWLYNIARGINTEPVTVRLVSKSIGCCKKFPGKTALKTVEDVTHWLSELAAEISERLEQDQEENNRRAKQIVVSFAQEINRKDVHSSKSLGLNSYDAKKITNDTLETLKKFAQKPDGSFRLKFLGISAGKFESCKHVSDISSFFKPTNRNCGNNSDKGEFSEIIKVNSNRGSEKSRVELSGTNQEKLDKCTNDISAFFKCSSKISNDNSSVKTEACDDKPDANFDFVPEENCQNWLGTKVETGILTSGSKLRQSAFKEEHKNELCTKIEAETLFFSGKIKSVRKKRPIKVDEESGNKNEVKLQEVTLDRTKEEIPVFSGNSNSLIFNALNSSISKTEPRNKNEATMLEQNLSRTEEKTQVFPGELNSTDFEKKFRKRSDVKVQEEKLNSIPSKKQPKNRNEVKIQEENSQNFSEAQGEIPVSSGELNDDIFKNEFWGRNEEKILQLSLNDIEEDAVNNYDFNQTLKDIESLQQETEDEYSNATIEADYSEVLKNKTEFPNFVEDTESPRQTSPVLTKNSDNTTKSFFLRYAQNLQRDRETLEADRKSLAQNEQSLKYADCSDDSSKSGSVSSSFFLRHAQKISSLKNHQISTDKNFNQQKHKVNIENSEIINSSVLKISEDLNQDKKSGETKYITKTSISGLKENSEQWTVFKVDEEISVYPEKSRILKETNNSKFENQTSICSECNEKVHQNNYITHMDHHMAQKLMAEERQLFQQQLQAATAKTSKSPVKIDPKIKPKSVKRKSNVLDTNCSIISFLSKEGKNLENENTKICPDCGKKVAVKDFSCHVDYHAAKKLHLQLNPVKCESRTNKKTVMSKKKKCADVNGVISVQNYFKNADKL